MKNKFTTAIILTITFILAGIAIFTAIRLYQLRNQSVSPTSPESKPAAASNEPQSKLQASSCTLSFNLTTSTPTPTPTPTVTPTPTPVPQCNSTCTTDSGCPSTLSCYKTGGQTTGNCRNSGCLTSTNCTCTTSTPTPTPTPTVTPTPTPTTPAYCGDSCTSNSNCSGGNMICYQGSCRNQSCVGESDCTCGVSTPAPTEPSLPNSGTEWPTVVSIGLGILVVLGSLLLAL